MPKTEMRGRTNFEELIVIEPRGEARGEAKAHPVVALEQVREEVALTG